MPMSSGGHVASSSECATRPKVREIGLTGYAVPTRRSLLIGRYVMATAEHREPCDSRGSCTVLGAPGGETPPGDSTFFAIRSHAHIHFTVRIGLKAGIFQSGHHRPVIWPTRLAVQQRQNGSHSEREPRQNEYDSAGRRRHGKWWVADESAKGNVASKQCAAKHPPAKHTEHQRPQQQTLL